MTNDAQRSGDVEDDDPPGALYQGVRRALVVGVDYYDEFSTLYGCANDARNVAAMLATHEDGTPNFTVALRTASSADDALSRRDLKKLVKELFAGDSEIALFYFAGHGHVEKTGGYLCTSEASSGDDGLPLADLFTLARDSAAQNKIVVLDSCHSGVAGNPAGHDVAELSVGMSILTASTEEQYASESRGSGVFTTLLVDALSGSAANLVGDITPGSVYAHVDQSLGPWQQRPVFKTNVKEFVSLRRVAPSVPVHDLLHLAALFPSEDFDFKLDPSFEPETRGRPAGAPPPDPVNTARFAILQKLNRVNLVKPFDAPHLWHAAIESKSCRLTPLGEHYRRLAAEGLITP